MGNPLVYLKVRNLENMKSESMLDQTNTKNLKKLFNRQNPKPLKLHDFIVSFL